ncbi:hypothetical protein MRX96_049663 [Rhipicephalus microplus]
MSTQHLQPVVRGYDLESMQVEKSSRPLDHQLIFPSLRGGYFEMASQPPSRSHTSDGRGDTANHKLWPTAGTSSTLPEGHPSKNIDEPCNLPLMAPDEYLIVIKRKILAT